MMGRKKKSPWQRIVKAYYAGTGCRFSADDIASLGRDGAIVQRAMLDDGNDEGIGDDGEPINEEDAPDGPD